MGTSGKKVKLEGSKEHFKLHISESCRTEMLSVEPKRNSPRRVGMDARKCREWPGSRIRKANVSGIAILFNIKSFMYVYMYRLQMVARKVYLPSDGWMVGEDCISFQFLLIILFVFIFVKRIGCTGLGEGRDITKVMSYPVHKAPTSCGVMVGNLTPKFFF